MLHEFLEDNNFTTDMTFGEFIRKKRRLLGLTQEDFSVLIGANRSTVGLWELGNTSPPIDKAAEIAKKLGAEIMIINCRDAYYDEHRKQIYLAGDKG